jgi:MFS family permease
VLSAAQVISGMGVAVGFTLSSLVVAELSGSVVISGFAGTAVVLGAALFALPTAKVAGRGGRRAGLTLAYGCASSGAAVSVVAIAFRSWPLMLAGLVLLGGGSAGNLAARYSATDLSPPGHAARHLSLVVWASTVGTVAGPNLVKPAEAVGLGLGLPDAAGPFALAGLSFLLATLIINMGLRPDPLLAAREFSPTADGAGPLSPPSGSPSPASPPPAGSPSTPPGPSSPPPGAFPPAGPLSPASPPPAGSPSSPHRLDLKGRRSATSDSARTSALYDAWMVLRATPAARTALIVIAVIHTAMVSIMSMTPVHLDHEGSTVSIIGMVISVHIAGMYVLSPVVGWVADRVGRRPVMVAGLMLLLVAAGLAGSASHGNVPQVTAGLFLLGLGWSCGLVAGSASLTEAVPIERRPAVQGLSDLTMNVCGATGTVVAGAIVGAASYGMLGAFIALLVVLTGIWLFLGTRPATGHTGS